MTEKRRFRELLLDPAPIVAPGVYDCLSALVVAQAGFSAALVTGAGVAASLLGVPDVGLVTMSEVLQQTRNIARCVDIPVIADCDTGYGNPLNVMRTVRDFEAAGVACLFIEDQVAPKKCGHFEGKQLISTLEMVRKIEAAVAARRDPDLVLMARTDAIAVGGIEEAIERGRAYVLAGADMIFVEAPRTHDELWRVAKELKSTGVPLMANMVEGGKTPLLDVTELVEMGYKVITFPGSLQRAALKTMLEVAQVLHATGSLRSQFPGRIASLGDRSSVLGLQSFQELERRFAAE